MARFHSAVVVLSLCVLPLTAASAQICAGAASFASGPVRLGGAIDIAEDARQYGAQIAFGKAAGPFASGTIALVDFDDLEDSGTSFAADVGYSLSMSAARSVELCPIVGIGYASADISQGGFSAELSSRTFGAGISIGGIVSSTPTFAFVPAVSVIYANEDAEAEGALELDTSENYGVITLAAGLVFNQRITLRPNIAFPVGLDDADASYGIGIAFNFGAPASR